MYKEYHEVPYNSKIKEAILGPFSWSQLFWLAPACYMSYQIAIRVPKLPFDSILFNRIHWFLPIIIAVIFVTFKHPNTNLSLSQYLITMAKFKMRQRTFYYTRKNIGNSKRKNERR